PLGRGGERDGHGVVAGGVERGGRRGQYGREAHTVRAAQDRQRLVACAPRGGQLQDDAANGRRRAQVDLDPLREGVVRAFPVGVLVRIGGVCRRVHLSVARFAGRPARREVGARRAGGAGQRDRRGVGGRVAVDGQRSGTGTGRGRSERDVDRTRRSGRDGAAIVGLREVTGD